MVGDVAKPGEYKFREGMTVLQALALSGGELRASTEKSREEIELVGELQGVDADIVLSTAKIARLEAEMSGTSEIASRPFLRTTPSPGTPSPRNGSSSTPAPTKSSGRRHRWVNFANC